MCYVCKLLAWGGAAFSGRLAACTPRGENRVRLRGGRWGERDKDVARGSPVIAMNNVAPRGAAQRGSLRSSDHPERRL